MADRQKMEEDFFSALTAETIPVKKLLEQVRHLYDSGETENAMEWRELLEEALADRNQADELLAVMYRTSDWDKNSPGRKEAAGKLLLRIFRRKRKEEFIKNAGFDSGVPFQECLRRASLLNSLHEGDLCLDKGWGFGTVKGVDAFYRKIKIDFKEKPGHEISFLHAAESLQLLSEDHILAVSRNKPEEFQSMLRDRPGDVVKLALRSYGQLAVQDLKDVVEEAGLEESSWKEFWSRARQQLKADPLVEIPARRTQPIVLRESFEELEKDWSAKFDAIKDPVEFCAFAEEFVQVAGSGQMKDELRDKIGSRFEELLQKGFGVTDEVTARVLGTMAMLGFEWSEGLAEKARVLVGGEELPWVLDSLPTRISIVFLEKAQEIAGEKLCDRLILLIGQMERSAFNDTVRFLESRGRIKDAIERMGAMLREGKQSSQMLYWLSKNMDSKDLAGLIEPRDFLSRIIGGISRPPEQGSDKSIELLKSLFREDDSIDKLFSMMQPEDRIYILSRVSEMRTWDSVESRSVIARVVRRFPELKKFMESVRRGEGERRVDRLTSWRSYNERRQKLQRIIEVEIPENSREIGVARSYGDLRENHEYKAAKEHQGILMRRKAEYERDLAMVKGATFENMPTETVGMGVRVVVGRPDGKQQEFCILGEWDREESLGIVSSESLVARSLAGRKKGDEVDLPSLEAAEGEVGTETCIIKDISRLPEAVLAWARG